MIGTDSLTIMKTVAVKLERWLLNARQGYMPLTDSDDVPKYVKPVRNRRAMTLSYPFMKPSSNFTLEILPKIDGSKGRRARIRQRIEDMDENGIKMDNLEKKMDEKKNKKNNNKSSADIPQHLSTKNINTRPINIKVNNLNERKSLSKCYIPPKKPPVITSPKHTYPGGRRAVLKQELTPTGELYSYTTPHKCHICGKTCYLPFTYQPFVRMNNNYIEVTQYYYDDNGNVINEEDVITVINAERDYRFRKDLTLRNKENSDLPIIVLAFDSEIRSSKI